MVLRESSSVPRAGICSCNPARSTGCFWPAISKLALSDSRLYAVRVSRRLQSASHRGKPQLQLTAIKSIEKELAGRDERASTGQTPVRDASCSNLRFSSGDSQTPKQNAPSDEVNDELFGFRFFILL